jgi:hypothetical protein
MRRLFRVEAGRGVELLQSETNISQ